MESQPKYEATVNWKKGKQIKTWSIYRQPSPQN